jgi:hypothetical protein
MSTLTAVPRRASSTAPDHADVDPVVSIADDTALVTYAHPHQLITDVWVRREAAWRRVGRWESPA